MPTKQLTRQEVEVVMERLAKYYDDYQPYNDSCACSIKYGVCDTHKQIQSNVYIGDVLDGTYEYFVSEVFAKVLHLYAQCGVAKSLQEIASESGWEEIWECGCVGSHLKNGARGIPLKHISQKHPSKKMEVLKSPEANALFSFLLQIGL